VPTIPNFDIATDLKVEFYLAGAGTNDFIIGVSRLGGPSVLADTSGGSPSFAWSDLSCVVNKAELSIGGSLVDYIYFQPEPGSANLILQSLEYDPAYSASFRPGVPVRVTLDDGTVDQVIWSGYVDTIQTSYDPDGNNLIQVSAFDSFKRLMNTRFPVFDTEVGPGYINPGDQLDLIAGYFGTSTHPSSQALEGEILDRYEEDVIPSPYVYEAIQIGLAIFWIDPETEEFVYINRPITSTPPVGTPVIGNNHGTPNHLCMSNIVTGLTDNVVYNSLLARLESVPSIKILKENADSIELYGKYAVDVSVNTTNSGAFLDWVNKVFQQYPTNLVEQVETPAIDRLGELTEAAFFVPGQIVGVKYDNDIVTIDDYFTVIKVNHFIDSNNWFTTLDLWNGA
jgi:hypothetical protein